MSSPLARTLREAHDPRRPALVGYLPAGFPDARGFAAAVPALFEAGLTALEIGLPGPAPHLDGPVVRDAAARGLAVIDTVDEALAAGAAAAPPGALLVALAYRRHLEEHGAEALVEAVAAHGFAGLLAPELPLAEQIALASPARARGIEQVLFASRREDFPLLRAVPDPVIYLQSAEMPTGGAFDAAAATARLAALTDALGDRPRTVLVGFGVRGPKEARVLAAAGTDGVVIGTRLLSAVEDGSAADLLRATAGALTGPG